MRTLCAMLAALCAAATARAQAVWTGPVGGGMLSVQEADVLEPGHFVLGSGVDNYDRNHGLGIDVVDVRVDTRLAIVSGLEMYTRYTISRAVSVPGTQEAPPPPADIIIMQDALTPQGAYRRMYWPLPYLGDYPASVSDMTPGEYVFGLKARIRRQDGWVPAVSLSGQVSIPADMSDHVLAKGSSSGSADWGLHTAATWKYRRLSTSVNLGYTFNGSLRRPDRHVRIAFSPPYIYETHDLRPDFLHGGIGARYRLLRGISVIGEASGWKPVMAHTASIDDGPACDILAGAELRYRAVGLTIGVRRHLNVPRDGRAQSSGGMGGGLDLSALSDIQRREYLRSIGVDQALHRSGVNLVVLGGPSFSVPDPQGSRRIPAVSYNHTTGNDGIIATLSFSF